MKKLVLLIALLSTAAAAVGCSATGNDDSASTSTSVTQNPASKNKLVGTRHEVGCTSTAGRLSRRCY